MSRHEYLRTWSQAHGFPAGSEVAGIARIYLSLNYFLVQPLVWLRFSPNLVTLFAPVIAVTALFVENKIAIAALVLTSLLVDGFDGAVAIIREKSSLVGGVWDGIVDRITESIWIIILYIAGISPAPLLAIWLLAATQEYARAKINQLAGNSLGVVTICERPVRGLFVAFAFLGAVFYANTLQLVVILWLVLQSIALAQVIALAQKQLR